MARYWVLGGGNAAYVHEQGNVYESPELDVRFGAGLRVHNTPVFPVLPGALEAPERLYTNASQHTGLLGVTLWKHYGRLSAPDPY